jgi:hypothetical protein
MMIPKDQIEHAEVLQHEKDQIEDNNNISTPSFPVCPFQLPSFLT